MHNLKKRGAKIMNRLTIDDLTSAYLALKSENKPPFIVRIAEHDENYDYIRLDQTAGDIIAAWKSGQNVICEFEYPDEESIDVGLRMLKDISGYKSSADGAMFGMRFSFGGNSSIDSSEFDAQS